MTIVPALTVTSMNLTCSSAAPPVSAQSVSAPLLTEQVKVTREMSAPIDQNLEYCFEF